MTEMIQRLFLTAFLLAAVQCRPATIEADDYDYDEDSDLDPDFGRPFDLQVLGYTQKTISLTWDMDVDTEIVDSYRVYYVHGSYNDVKTVHDTEPQHTLRGLKPYTNYEIWVVSIINGTESDKSDPVAAQTDVAEPSAPKILNVTCYDTGQLYVEWEGPTEFYRSVDYYKLYYKSYGAEAFDYITIQNDSAEPNQRFLIKELQGNQEYVIKICAGTKSLSKPNQTFLGNSSEERRIFLPKEKCQASILGTDFQAELNAGMIVGAVGAVLFLLLAIIGFIVWRQYFKAAYYYLDEPHRIVPPASVPDWEDAPGPESGEESGSITVSGFASHLISHHADSDAGFAKEYTDIQKYCSKQIKATSEHSSHVDNKHKNRYLNIVAYDHSRVRLLPLAGQKKTSDYINANYIDGFQKANAYIGTQGPLTETTEAFWRMIWEQNVYVVVMITNLHERGRRKCDLYWPKAVEESETYGNIEVTLDSEEVTANYTVRKMKIKHLKDHSGEWVTNVSTLKRKKGMTSEREIQQFHYTSWPDHGVPSQILPVLSFIRKSASLNPADGGPIVVHCSAGVGRTGTYIAIDSLLQQARAKGEINVYGFLKHIRGQRNHLVQTEEQYIFIHDAVLEAIRSAVTEVPREDIAQYVESLLNDATKGEFGGLDFDEGDTLIDAHFKLVTEMQPSEYHYMSAQMDCNVEKNREASLTPLENSRIPLAPKPGVEGSDYINASWLSGHEKLKEFIITQHPTLNVKEDFWRMLWDHNAQTVVLLSPVDDASDFPTFWPLREKDFELETFRVRFVDEAVHEGHSTLDFVVSSQHDDYELAVRIIHCPDWSHSIPKVSKNFNVLKLVQDWHLEYQDGPLVVVDKNGGTEAATFCALTTLCKQLESYNAIDCYQVAKLYHDKRPGIWRSPDDVLYLYKAMEALISTNQTNPLQQPPEKSDSGGAATATTSVADAPLNSRASSSGHSSLVPPERRHSTSASDWSPNGSVLKKSQNRNPISGDKPMSNGHSRRHSLPNGNGCITVPLKETANTNSVLNSSSNRQEDDEEDEEISETAALTAV